VIYGSIVKEIRKRGRPRTFDRDAAIDAAMLLFWSRGYETTSLADLTAALGIAPASLYAAFGSKEQLFHEAIKRYGEKYGGFDPATLAAAPSARALVATLLQGAATAYTVDGQPRGCMVISAAANCSPDSADVERALRNTRRTNEAQLAKRLERAVRDGELSRGTDARTLAKFVATVLQGMSIQARDGANRSALLAVANAALAVVDASVARPRRARPSPSSSIERVTARAPRSARGSRAATRWSPRARPRPRD
jgi:AcrR family transcriptional regulator